mgnify:CR=1 FL=1
MKYCKKCVMASTRPDIVFDANGICDACHSAVEKDTTDWREREDEFREFVDWAQSEARRRGNAHDCVVAVSGGKDSTYIVLKCIEYGLRPLCVSFEPTRMTKIGQKNLENLQRYTDVIQYKKDRSIYKQLGLIGFRTLGDHDWPNHLGIFTTPVKMACSVNMPLILYGENCQAEYGGPDDACRHTQTIDRRWMEEFGGLLGMRVSDLLDMGFDERDLAPYTYPTDSELKAKGIRGVFLGYFFRWDVRKQLDYVKAHGFSVRETPVEGSYWEFENLDCALVGIHDMMKFRKFAFGRATDQVSLDIRNSGLARSDAVDVVNRLDGKYSDELISMFCDHFGITRQKFDQVVLAFTNKDLFEADEQGNLVMENMNRPLKKFPTV